MPGRWATGEVRGHGIALPCRSWRAQATWRPISMGGGTNAFIAGGHAPAYADVMHLGCGLDECAAD